MGQRELRRPDLPNDDGAAGIGTLVTCTAGPGGYTDVELLRFEVGDCP